MLADITQGMTTKQTKPRPDASAALHPITPAWGGGWYENEILWGNKQGNVLLGVWHSENNHSEYTTSSEVPHYYPPPPQMLPSLYLGLPFGRISQ